jgi:multidrug efflux system outer membrane protein
MNKTAPLLALALLAGCTTLGPDYKRPEFALPAEYQYAASPQGGVLATDWWTLFNDVELNRLIAAAVTNNTDARLAAARVLEAEGVLREAGAALSPDIGGGYAFTRNRVSTQAWPPPPATVPLVRPLHQVAASTSYEVDFWGRIARLNEAARAAYLATRYGQDVTALALASMTAQTYFALRSLDAQIGVLGQTIAARRDALTLAQARLQAGLASELDTQQAQGALADADVQRVDAQRQRALLERQLSQLAGRFDLSLAAGDVLQLPLPPLPPAGLPSSLLDRRPDVRAAEQTLVAANAQIGVARAALYPTLNLTGALGLQSAALADLLSGGATIWTLGFALTQPIFDGGRREARADQAQARQQQALAGYQRSVETAFREVSEAMINLSKAAEAEAAIGVRLQAARQALELSTLRYDAGYSPFLEVLDAQRTANDAELAFVRYRQLRLTFSVDLMKALGGGWSTDRR